MKHFHNAAQVDNELRAIGKLCGGADENVVKVFNFRNRVTFDTEPCAFIDMESCDWNLDQYIGGMWSYGIVHTTLEVRRNEIWSIILQIAKGLKHIHGEKEVHRDLKPQNGIILSKIMLTMSPLQSQGLAMENCGFRLDKRGHIQEKD